MRRREFIIGLGATTMGALAARAQGRIVRIGLLALVNSAVPQRGFLRQFLEGLHDLGYVEDQNLTVFFRSAEGDESRLPALAVELVALNVDVIVTAGTGVYAAAEATKTIPIVMASAGDVVATGLVASLAHPGGNVTGQTFFHPELMAKRLELLKQVLPLLRRAGVLLWRDNPSNARIVDAMTAAANKLKLELLPIRIGGAAEFDKAFSEDVAGKVEGLIVADHAQFLAKSSALAALAAKLSLPTIGSLELAQSGGLIGYGVEFPVMYRRAAVFVDKILKGARPGDIPIEQATKFRMVVNLKTAAALSIDVPLTVLAAADEAIE